MRGPRSFARLLASDLRYGLGTAVPRFAVVAAIGALALFLSYVRIRIYLPQMEGPLTLGETVLCLWRGMLPYVPSLDEPFQFPMQWFALLAVITYVVLDYPLRDLEGFGSSLIVASRNRWAWWLAKCGWVVACALLCWCLCLGICALVTLAAGGAWTFGARPGVAAVLDAAKGDAVSQSVEQLLATSGASVTTEAASCDLLAATLAIALALCAILLLQLVVTLMVHPVVGLFATIAVLLFSAFFTRWWLPGNYLMLARTDALLQDGAASNPLVGAALCLVLGACCAAAGGILFSRKDLMGRRSDAL